MLHLWVLAFEAVLMQDLLTNQGDPEPNAFLIISPFLAEPVPLLTLPFLCKTLPPLTLEVWVWPQSLCTSKYKSCHLGPWTGCIFQTAVFPDPHALLESCHSPSSGGDYFLFSWTCGCLDDHNGLKTTGLDFGGNTIKSTIIPPSGILSLDTHASNPDTLLWRIPATWWGHTQVSPSDPGQEPAINQPDVCDWGFRWFRGQMDGWTDGQEDVERQRQQIWKNVNCRI